MTGMKNHQSSKMGDCLMVFTLMPELKNNQERRNIICIPEREITFNYLYTGQWKYSKMRDLNGLHKPRLGISTPCVIEETALIQEIRHRPTAMGG